MRGLKLLELAPNNSAALTIENPSLQAGQWSAAIEDLQRSIEIDVKEGKTADASVLNNLGNAKGRLEIGTLRWKISSKRRRTIP